MARKTCKGCKANDFDYEKWCSLGFAKKPKSDGYDGTDENCPKPTSTRKLYEAIVRQREEQEAK